MLHVQAGGVVSTRLDLPDDSTVADLLAALAPHAPVGRPGLRVIAGGTALRDPSAPLASALGKPPGAGPARVLVLASGPPPASDPVAAAAARAARLDALDAEARRIAGRVAGGGGGTAAAAAPRADPPPPRRPSRHYALEDAGTGALPPAFATLPPAGQEALVSALALAARGAASLAGGDAASARDELALAEDRFAAAAASPAGRALLGRSDNLALTILDSCWAAFLLRDGSALQAGGVDRLASARASLEAVHGAGLARLLSRSGANPKAASAGASTAARLACLEGVVAWHGGSVAVARERLLAAVEAWRAARRADAAAAAQRSARAAWGATASGRAVDAAALDSLGAMGFDRPLAAAALRSTDNDVHAALDALNDAALSAALVQAAAERAEKVERRARRRRSGDVDVSTAAQAEGAVPSPPAATTVEDALRRAGRASTARAATASLGNALVEYLRFVGEGEAADGVAADMAAAAAGEEGG